MCIFPRPIYIHEQRVIRQFWLQAGQDQVQRVVIINSDKDLYRYNSDKNDMILTKVI